MKKTMIFLFILIIVSKAGGQELKSVWVLPAGSPGWDVITAITETSEGKIAVGGAFYDSLSIENTTIKSQGSRDCFLALVTDRGKISKIITVGGKGFDYIREIEPYTNGGVSVVIEFNENIEISKTSIPAIGSNNFAIVTFDNNLNLLGYQVISANKSGKIAGIKNYKDDNLIFTGWFEDSLKVNNNANITARDQNVFLGSLTKDKKVNWIKSFNVPGRDFVEAFKTDKSGNIFSLGVTSDGNFDGIKKPSLKDDNLVQIYVMKSNLDGKTIDLFYPISGTDVNPVDILHDSTSVWILANFNHSVFLNEKELFSYGMSDVVLIKYDYLNGKILSYQFGGAGNDLGAALAKSGDKILITGSYTSELSFAGKLFKPKGFGSDIYIASFDKNCIPDYLQPFEGEKSEFPCEILASGSKIYLSGEFAGKIPFGISDYISKGCEDIFLACLEKCSTSNPLSITTKQISENLLITTWELTAPEGFTDYHWEENLSDVRTLLVNEPGTYTIAVTDKSGCVYRDSVILKMAKSSQISKIDNQNHPFFLFPTITSENVSWQPSSTWVGEKALLRITDFSGKIISQNEIDTVEDAEYKISFSDKPEGAYLVEIFGNQFHETSKIIVKR